MNCELARLGVALGPEGRAGELGTPLAEHLRGCPACSVPAAREAAFDRAVAMAMNDVPVPADLQTRLIQAEFARRGAGLRRTVYRGLGRVAALAMALGIAGGASWRYRPAIDADQVAMSADGERKNPPDAVREWLARQDLPPELPFDFDYRFHAFHGRGELGGVGAPVVVFLRGGDFARVYIVRDSAANTDRLRGAESSLCRVAVVASPIRKDVRYVIVHTTDTLDPFLRQLQGPFG